MDMLSLLGILVAVVALALGQTMDGGQFSSLFNIPALIIVLGGTLGAIMLQVSSETFKRSLQMINWVFVPPTFNFALNIKKIVRWSELARREGILGLESMINKEQDAFSQKALQLLVDGRDPATIRHILTADIDNHEFSDMRAAKVFEAMGGYTPTLGILGAVMGLIHVMENLSDPSNLGQGIATAFVATIYGVGLANLVFIPTSKKLQSYVEQHALEKEMLMEGMVLIAQGENPRNIASRLQSYDRSIHA
ncbi:MAG: flagellar motor protein [Gammaproteobacteria bacterium]|nr:flagellar motor protein [Gammaproteobacteria bacterium]